jgi:hypothetical protein
VTVGLDSWQAHQLGGDNNRTNKKNVIRKYIVLQLIDLPLFILLSIFILLAPAFALRRPHGYEDSAVV